MAKSKSKYNAEKAVKIYLECEALMNEFFKETDYCYKNCISQEESKCHFAVSELRGRNIGCCLGTYVSRLENSFVTKYLGDVTVYDNKLGKYVQKTDPKKLEEMCMKDRETFLFIKKRDEKYRTPKNTEGPFGEKKYRPCDYHTEEGCILKDFKSPTCIGWICGSYSQYLADEFGLEYCSPSSFFEYILSTIHGNDSGLEKERIETFKQSIKSAIEKVKAKKSGKNVQN